MNASLKLCVASLLLFACGCGPGPGASLAPVTGLVTLDGQPLPAATVTFYPEQGRPSFAQTDFDGQFALRFTEDFDGAVVGTHSVVINYGGPQEPGAPSMPSARPSRTKRLPATQVEWPETVTVQSQGENRIDFALTTSRR